MDSIYTNGGHTRFTFFNCNDRISDFVKQGCVHKSLTGNFNCFLFMKLFIKTIDKEITLNNE